MRLIIAGLLFLMALPAFVFSQDVAATSAENWRNPNSVRVEEAEKAFTAEWIGKTKNESIFVWVYREGGPIFLFSLFHIDTFLLNRWGMYALVIDPEGNAHWITHTPKKKSVSFSEEFLSITDGATTFEGEDGSYRLEARFGDLEGTIDISNRLPAWKPGTGRLDYNEEGSLYQKRILVSPWADAKGTISISGDTFEIEGHGYVSKTRFANPLTRFAPYIHSLKLYSDEQFIYLLDVTLNDSYDNEIVPMLIVAEDDEWLFTTQDYTYEILETVKVEGLPYEYPQRIRLMAEDSGYFLDGVYSEERLLNVTDVFNEIPAIVRRTLTLLISRPIYFRAAGGFVGTLTHPDGTITQLDLAGPYEYTVVR